MPTLAAGDITALTTAIGDFFTGILAFIVDMSPLLALIAAVYLAVSWIVRVASVKKVR